MASETLIIGSKSRILNDSGLVVHPTTLEWLVIQVSKSVRQKINPTIVP